MKIAIPADDKTMEGNVSNSFGRAPYYLIYDTETGQSEFIENSAAQAQGGAGIKAAQGVVDSKAKTLLTPRCGENAAKVLQEAQVKIYQSVVGSLSKNIQTFEAGKLSPLLEIHAGHHGH